MAFEIDPKDTTRADAFELWMKAPNPMVTIFKTMDVTNLVQMSKRRDLKFNMLMDYCIGKAAAGIKEFYILPVGDKLMQYDSIAVSTIVRNRDGEVGYCDIEYSENLDVFNEEYTKYTSQVAENCGKGICLMKAWLLGHLQSLRQKLTELLTCIRIYSRIRF